jgi:hypothetical protein
MRIREKLNIKNKSADTKATRKRISEMVKSMI